MSRVLVIGCGGVASVAIHKICQVSDVFTDLCIASRTVSKCDVLAEELKGNTKTNITTAKVDAEKESENTIMWLQSAEEPSLALPIIKPEIVKEDYDPIVEDELIKSLGEDIENAYLAVYVTITVPSDLTKMTCNLKAPIIVNMDTMKGTQLIAGNEDYQVRFPIYDILDAKKQKDGE